MKPVVFLSDGPGLPEAVKRDLPKEILDQPVIVYERVIEVFRTKTDPPAELKLIYRQIL